MKKTFNWIALFSALAPFAYLAIVWPSLPQVVPMHFDTEMKPDRMGDKSELIVVGIIMFVVSMFVFFLLKNIHRFDPKRKNAEPSLIFEKLAFGTVVFISALTILIFSSAKGGSLFPHLLFPLLGLMFAFIGHNMNGIQPNYFAGIRLPWTLSDDENWHKTHQLGSKVWLIGGLLIAAVSFFLPPQVAFVFFLITIAVMVIIPVVYSYLFFKKHT